MTAPSIPTLHLESPLAEGCEVVTVAEPLTVECECVAAGPQYVNAGNPHHDGSPEECPDCYMGEKLYVGRAVFVYPCPECGGSGNGKLDGIEQDWIKCGGCGGSGLPAQPVEIAQQVPIEAWSKRPRFTESVLVSDVGRLVTRLGIIAAIDDQLPFSDFSPGRWAVLFTRSGDPYPYAGERHEGWNA